jgi:1-phosphofructokinase
MNNGPKSFDVVTVTLNPAVDRTVTIPNFTAGVVNRVETERSDPGGKGVNVASALADYGPSVAVTGFLGDENATSFEELFALKKIEDQFVRIAGRTRVGIKITDPVNHQTTDINFPGPAPEPDGIVTLMQRLGTLDAEYFVLSGSVPPGVSTAIYAQITTMLRTRGRQVVLDTSGEPLRHAIESKPYIVKPNIHELESLLGESLTDSEAIVKAARKLNSLGIELVVVSMGKEGACFVTADTVITARPPDIEVRSTVGAGDAMVAGIIAGKLEGLTLAGCAQLATAFSLDVLISGESGITSRPGVEALLRQVTTVD